ncbi:MAG: DUF327 family protein [Candidatus Wallbacteria bacterium]|nr:DUF327 family protein [Candidatus Wallbacteria bacterium]
MRVNTDKDIREIQQRGKKSIEKQAGIFSALFDAQVDKKITERVKRLSDEVEKLSQDLLYYRNPDVLRRFKQKVREFTQELLSQYKVKTIVSKVANREGLPKVHQIVESIDQKMDEITESAMLKLKKEVLQTKISEIRGLMVDAIA